MHFEILVIMSFGLAMDAFAVSVTNGIGYRMPPLRNALWTGFAFGTAQALMPLGGYFAGHTFSKAVGGFDHWLALILLGIIGGRMLWEAAAPKEGHAPSRQFTYKTLWMQAVATSIDALAVGVSLGVMGVNIFAATAIIGIVTFFCCFCGVFIGRRFGSLFQSKAEMLGGIILILIGVQIFVEHMGLVPFFH